MQSAEFVTRARREGDVLIVVAAGVATVASLRELRAFIGMHLAMRDARAVVVDLRQAVHALTADDWEAAARESARAGLCPPIAMIVQDHNYIPVVHHCYRVAECGGQLRKAFTNVTAALSWAARRREYWTLKAVSPWPVR